MATPFLKSVAEYIHEHYKDNVENLCIVLPNKRGALFLKRYLAASFQKTIWLPRIISAEDMVAEQSGLQTLGEIDLICHLYESYRYCYGEDAESFDSFVRWGQLILQDFNEIDRYLADPAQLYENLKEIKVIENWSLASEELSEFQQNYLKFMGSLGAIYRHFTAFLLSKGWAYQGLAYRQAVAMVEKGSFAASCHKLLFCGFNALNSAELRIFQHYHAAKKADLLWDADVYYLDHPGHEAGMFLRKNLAFFAQKHPLFVGDYFREEKQIDIVSVPRQMGQALVVKKSVQDLLDRGIAPDRIAIVLANERLLWPVLRQLPDAVSAVNITMEYPLRYTSSYALLDALLQIQLTYSKQNRKHKTVYYKELLALLRQPLTGHLVKKMAPGLRLQSIIREISSRNISFLTAARLQTYFGEAPALLSLLTEHASMKPYCRGMKHCIEALIEAFADESPSSETRLELEYLGTFLRGFNRLSEIMDQYPYFNHPRSFRQLFSQVIGSSTAPFYGEPLQGLQLMGVLETRTLDFDYLILANVNESILPSGKSVNSFIPNDLKRAFGLPLYLEKDAIYAYHFYRLLQRAKEVVITYDSETDTFGKGEKSRFITQLQLELSHYSGKVRIREMAAAPDIRSSALLGSTSIRKDDDSLDLILKKALSDAEYSGLSPSSLIAYKECALKFYFRYGAGLKEVKVVEESAEAGTFGSILHRSLEKLYSDFTGAAVTAKQLLGKISLIEHTVKESFAEFFDSPEVSGKNLLQLEVIKVYVEKLMNSDIERVRGLEKKQTPMVLYGVEKEFSASLSIPLAGIPATVYIKGKVDRIDSCNGLYRIIDYKSSIRQNDKFVFPGIDPLFTDKKYNKALQLMLYAWLLHKNQVAPPQALLPGIIAFKDFAAEPIHIKDSDGEALTLSIQLMNEFETGLQNFIASVFDRHQAFGQTEDEEVCRYCDFKLVCNR